MLRKGLGVLAAVGYLAGVAVAGTLYYVRDDTKELWKLDTDTLVRTRVGATGVGGDFGDLAYDRNTNTMFFVAGRGNNNLYTINLNTGAATLVGSHGVGDLFTLGVDSSGQLYGQSTNTRVYKIDRNTGSAAPIGSNNVYPGGYTWNYNTNQMIFLEAGGGAVFEVNLTNGSATLLKAGQGFINDNDIAWDWDKNQYWVMDWSGSLIKFDSSFNRTNVGSGYGSVASVAYVPEPAALALLMLGGLALIRRR
jgi:MYXO-CTERM domain-containing protein